MKLFQNQCENKLELENTLFNVPIYRQSKEKYSSELKEDFTKYEKLLEKEINDKNYIENYFYNSEVQDKRYIGWIEWEGNYVWEFNQIIGWIQFYQHGTLLKSNLWIMKSKNIRKRPKKKLIDYFGKLGDVSDISYKDNSQIILDIIHFLDDAQLGLLGNEKLKQYYIERLWVLRFINFLDIKSLMEENIKR